MDTRLLEMYIKLQPKFREVSGEWQLADKGYFEGQTGYYTGTWNVHTSGNPKHDRCSFVTTLRHFYCKPDEAIWLPKPIDDSSEEAQRRSLVGMLNKKGQENLDYLFYTSLVKSRLINFLESNNQTEALLRCLCEQWEVKV